MTTQTQIKHGQVVNLGRHRLMCGDATNRDDVMKLIGLDKVGLVLTDPPYGVDIVNSGGHYKGLWGAKRKIQLGYDTDKPARSYPEIIGDKDTAASRLNYEIIKDVIDKHIIWGYQYFTDFLPPAKGLIVWDKQRTTTTYGACEIAYTSFLTHNILYQYMWNGFLKYGSKELNPQPILHPAQKSVELHAHILDEYSNDGDTVLDCFGGSGTTLIACEVSNRTCLIMEISPEYCNIIINRYNKLTEGNLFQNGTD